jgi:tRNA modification GTPase
MFDRPDDTIAAISSPAGASVRGIIRISGPEAFSAAAHVFRHDGDEPLENAGGHRRLSGRMVLDHRTTLPGEAYCFRAPASYTRQDVVELHLPGSPPILALILEKLTGQGIRAAEPGEFTARAFFNGALDLTRVEGVAAVIHARNDSQLRASEALLHGRLSTQTALLRDQLADLLALLEAEIDFAEEDIDFVSPDQVKQTVNSVLESLQNLMQSAPAVERLGMLPEVVLVGRPNAGKSTLFNYLTGTDRAIRSATAGTTRDVLTAPMTLQRGEIMLSDCAGLIIGAVSGETANDVITQQAEVAAQRSIRMADLICLVVDAAATDHEQVGRFLSALPEKPCLVIANKIDSLTPSQKKSWSAASPGKRQVFPVSAVTGEGVADLLQHIEQRMFTEVTSHGSDVLALSNRQREALQTAQNSTQRAYALAHQSRHIADQLELIALEVREAMHALSLLTGEVTTEDLLGRIFSNFCIGK